MRSFLPTGLLLAASAVLALGDDAHPGFFRSLPLDEHVPYPVHVATDRGMTTLLFPIPPDNFFASKIVFIDPREGQSATDFSADPRVDFVCLAHKGSSYCSIRATRPTSRDTMTVMIADRAYQLFLSADEENPAFTIQFTQARGAGTAAAVVSPDRLIGCINTAKAYSLLAKNAPERLSDVTYVRPARICSYTDFRVLIDEIFRFDKEDTLVFHVLLENQTDHEIPYNPHGLGVEVQRVDRALDPSIPPARYRASIVDAAGVIPPHSVVPAYFGVTGTPEGGRADIDPATTANKFTILVPRAVADVPVAVPAPPVAPAKPAPLTAPASIPSPALSSKRGPVLSRNDAVSNDLPPLP